MSKTFFIYPIWFVSFLTDGVFCSSFASSGFAGVLSKYDSVFCFHPLGFCWRWVFQYSRWHQYEISTMLDFNISFITKITQNVFQCFNNVTVDWILELKICFSFLQIFMNYISCFSLTLIVFQHLCMRRSPVVLFTLRGLWCCFGLHRI